MRSNLNYKNLKKSVSSHGTRTSRQETEGNRLNRGQSLPSAPNQLRGAHPVQVLARRTLHNPDRCCFCSDTSQTSYPSTQLRGSKGPTKRNTRLPAISNLIEKISSNSHCLTHISRLNGDRQEQSGYIRSMKKSCME